MQTGPGWSCPVSTTLQNPLLDFKNYFCYGFLWIPSNARRKLDRAYSFRVQSGKITVWRHLDMVGASPTEWQLITLRGGLQWQISKIIFILSLVALTREIRNGSWFENWNFYWRGVLCRNSFFQTHIESWFKYWLLYFQFPSTVHLSNRVIFT